MIEAVYHVVGQPKMFWEDFKEKFQDRFQDHVYGPTVRDVLKQSPAIKGMAGPMYDGEHMGYPVVRYESWDLYEVLSR
jgi:hypothetical protein